jgi:L-ascorbate 6-phosphate lactonase
LVKITWLGQATFLLEDAGTKAVIDPFFSEHSARLYPPPSIEVARDVDWVLITHEHLDHLDPASLTAVSAVAPDSRFVVPRAIAAQLHPLVPSDRIVVVDVGQKIPLAPNLMLAATPAFHGMTPEDGYSDGSVNGSGPRFVGYVISSEATTIYHAGDTIVTDDLVHALASYVIDVAMLPVNGRDYFRERAGLVGNMSAREAVGLAETIGAKVLIPMHWDLFAGNTERPGAVLDAVDNQSVHVLYLARGLAHLLSS